MMMFSIVLFSCISGQFVFWCFVHPPSSWLESVFSHFVDAGNDLSLYDYWWVQTYCLSDDVQHLNLSYIYVTVYSSVVYSNRWTGGSYLH